MKEKWWIWGIVIAFALTVLSPLASPWPDGLERVAEDLGFMEKAREPLFKVIPDYVFPGIGHEALATILAGIIGTAITLGLSYGLARIMKQRA
ncbi:MAG: PDGLE domain-containing protein [Anaerolineae bacterium]|nr:PDGLE domain-containing protein [Anaerolineae bacterium]MDW8101959.1 PDGLE domain-containing protein [Anaerolineae bacterium]